LTPEEPLRKLKAMSEVDLKSGLQMLEDGRRHVSGLIPDWVFGPVDSRRYGRSLGVNPFPKEEKVCSFDCPYCECGWTTRLRTGVDASLDWPEVGIVEAEIEKALIQIQQRGESLDAITVAGNGEPTLHPRFPDLTRGILRLRDRFASQAKVIVLTNASELTREDVREALLLVDEACLKLDAVGEGVAKRVNLPHGKVSLERILRSLQSFPAPIIQTMFVHGRVDNTKPEDIEPWLEALERISPSRVDLFSLDRATPDPDLRKVPATAIEKIADLARKRLGVPVFVY